VTPLLEALRAALAGRPGVRLAYVFGSAARDTLRTGSDVDVAVLFAVRPSLDEQCALGEDLTRVAGRRVDLVDLGLAPPLLLREVVKGGRLLWAADEDERLDFETRALARYMDTAHLRRVQAEYLREWAEAYRARER
jgi:predicted nucleotidyltransferase